MDWVLELKSGKSAFREGELRSFVPIGYMGYLPPEHAETFDPLDATTGLAGLIELGDAWQSVDIFYALTLVLLNRELGNVAYFVRTENERIAGRRKAVAGRLGICRVHRSSKTYSPTSKTEGRKGIF